MTKRIAGWFLLFGMVFTCRTGVIAQSTPQTSTQGMQTTQEPATDAQQKNVQEYIDLLRSDVRQQKAQIMGAVMQLSAQEAAQFWPIYSEYDAELSRLNDLRVTNIKDYAQNYSKMTDAKADELATNAFNYQKERSALLTKYYGRVKASLGAVQAARFAQVENQLLNIIDLQIASSLPVVGQ